MRGFERQNKRRRPQTITDTHHLLAYVEASGGEGAGRAARQAQLALFAAQLDHLERRLQSACAPHSKYANYFSTGERGGRRGRVRRPPLTALAQCWRRRWRWARRPRPAPSARSWRRATRPPWAARWPSWRRSRRAATPRRWRRCSTACWPRCCPVSRSSRGRGPLGRA